MQWLNRLIDRWQSPAPPYYSPFLDLLTMITKQLEELKSMAKDLNQTIIELNNDITAQTSVIQGFLTFSKGLAERAALELEAAKNLGATDVQLAGLQALHSGIASNSQMLATAMGANTPSADPRPVPAPEPAPAPAPTASPAPLAEGVAVPDA